MLDALQRDGITPLPVGLSSSQADELRDYLVARAAYSAHVKAHGDGVARTWREAAEGLEVWCHDMGDVILAPHLLELALSVTPLMRAYLDAPPLLYSLNAFWARPGSTTRSDIQAWHRDADDERFAGVFVYGTDVLVAADGPHRFRAGSHRGRDDGYEIAVYGPAGTAFVADTRGLHRGDKPLVGVRLLLWARFGVSDPPESYSWDRLEPIPAALLGDRYPVDPALREVMRLVAR